MSSTQLDVSSPITSDPRPDRHPLQTVLQVMALLAAAVTLWLAYHAGLLQIGLGVLLCAAATVALIVTLVRLVRRRTYVGWLANPFAKGSRAFGVQFLMRAALWLLTTYAAVLAFPRAVTSTEEATVSYTGIWGAAVLLVLLGLLPVRRVNRLNLAAVVVAVTALAVQLIPLHLPAWGTVTVGAPVQGLWVVGAGGRSGLVNHHYSVRQQRDALDLAVPFARQSDRPPTALTDYPSYGQPVLAPADGLVVTAVDAHPDQAIGSTDAAHPLGNHVVLDLGQRRYLLLAHLKPGSLQVREGQPIRRGQQLAHVGNSGNTSEPHLHLQLQSGPDLVTADGIFYPDLFTYPVAFAGAERNRAGTITPSARDLRTNDLVTFR